MAATTPEHKIFLQDFNLKIALVKSVFSECLTKIELMICLPQLLDNKGKILQFYIHTKPQLQFLLNTFSKLGKHKNSMDTIEKSEQSEKKKKLWNGQFFKNTKVGNSVKIHSVAARAVDVLTNSECLVKHREKYLKNLPQGDNSLKLVRFIKDLIDIYMETASLSCQELRERDEEIRKAVALSQAIQRDIVAIQSTQRRRKQQSEKELARKKGLLEKYIYLKKQLGNKYSKMLLNLRHSSEREMALEMDASKENENDLAQLVITLNEKYNSLINNHLLREKKIKNKLGKTEAHLASWISKYDSDISEKRLQLEDLQDQFKNICLNIEDLEDQLDNVDMLYRRFKTEEEYAQREKLEETAMLFLRNKAAFKIQRYWRVYRQMKLVRRTGGNGKKKSKKVNEDD